MGICCMAKKLLTGALVQKGGDIWIPMAGWFMLRFDRKQKNSVKQLSFNKKIKKIGVFFFFIGVVLLSHMAVLFLFF